ncbi:acylneuraminate cytidylyltransferase family protein [Amylibacter sp. IMCC11727]|uniref:acylneuraminate cytidylyltransferase family protein n=1 Tax=Amylibacter sp. IMCC11727 TaxID=3039851 RepID=UPI00244E3BE5|nr:acylneuraminate cytidylyltransferase family protein [Amylibacter sp. IMCC11727]WGI22124.1 acylneuraminate cytidylyltransferase family protein [Amylibacter sp. IMCC11727]
MIRSNHTAFLFCRGGSKGIPDKNIKMVAGKPLLAWSVECALASKYVSRVVVSTDSKRIADVAQTVGAEVIMRPDELATDTASELLAWRHAIQVEHDTLQGTFVSLPATSPLRVPQDVDTGIERFYAGGCDIVFGISEAHRSPYLNMVTRDSDGLIGLVNPGLGATRRQDVPDVFDITTCVYVGAVPYIETCKGLMDGRVAGVDIPVERALDLDTPYDLHLAELLLKHPFQKDMK